MRFEARAVLRGEAAQLGLWEVLDTAVDTLYGPFSRAMAVSAVREWNRLPEVDMPDSTSRTRVL